MYRIIPYAILQSLLLTAAQVLLKLAMQRMPPFAWTRAFCGSLLVNWQFAASGLFFAAASLLWMYIVRVFPLSTAWPLVSLSYVFGMLAAVVFFHEHVSAVRWAGVALILLGCALTAQGQTPAQMRQQIRQAAASVETMQCDFVQTRHVSLLGGEPVVSRGTLHFQQPDRLRWEYQSPRCYTVILNGSKLLLQGDGRSDVVDTRRNRMFREIARLIISSVADPPLADDRDFRVSLSSGSSQWTATLEPRRKPLRRLFRQIRLHFDRQRKCVVQVELVEPTGDTTTIVLRNQRTNVPIPAQTFAVSKLNVQS